MIGLKMIMCKAKIYAPIRQSFMFPYVYDGVHLLADLIRIYNNTGD